MENLITELLFVTSPKNWPKTILDVSLKLWHQKNNKNIDDFLKRNLWSKKLFSSKQDRFEDCCKDWFLVFVIIAVPLQAKWAGRKQI